jgi:hypothetical protein
VENFEIGVAGIVVAVEAKVGLGVQDDAGKNKCRSDCHSPLHVVILNGAARSG